MNRCLELLDSPPELPLVARSNTQLDKITETCT